MSLMAIRLGNPRERGQHPPPASDVLPMSSPPPRGMGRAVGPYHGGVGTAWPYAMEMMVGKLAKPMYIPFYALVAIDMLWKRDAISRGVAWGLG